MSQIYAKDDAPGGDFSNFYHNRMITSKVNFSSKLFSSRVFNDSRGHESLVSTKNTSTGSPDPQIPGKQSKGRASLSMSRQNFNFAKNQENKSSIAFGNQDASRLSSTRRRESRLTSNNYIDTGDSEIMDLFNQEKY